VTPTNEYPPIIESSIHDFTGYLYENSLKNSLVTNALGNTPMRIIAKDPDQVNAFLFIL